MHSCDLERFFGDLASHVPTETGTSFLFVSATFPTLPTTLMTTRLVIQQQWHVYEEGFRADLLCFHAHLATYRQLGLLILAVVLHPGPMEVQVGLTHPASDIKTLCIKWEGSTPVGLGGWYYVQPKGFIYTPSHPAKYPWIKYPPAPQDLPCFYCASSLTHGGTTETSQASGTITGFGNDQGHVRFAELLLNISRPQHSYHEYRLEGDAGSRGVGRHSAEVCLYLPGNPAWEAILMSEET